MSEELLAELEQLRGEVKELRGERNKWKSERDELNEVLGPALEAQRRELIRDKGFDPTSTQGQRLAKAMVDGEIQPDGSDLVEVARDGFGYEPSLARRELTDSEFVYQYFSDRGRDLDAVAVSNDPPSDAQAIAEAEAAGDHDTARKLKAGILAKGLQ